MYTIAIQPDDVPLVSGRRQSFSTRWRELAEESGHKVRMVNAYEEGRFFSQIQGCDAFMWAFWNVPKSREPGKRIMAALYHADSLLTFPSWRTSWFFEDKIAQRYLMEASDIPTPKTWVFWRQKDAIDFLKSTTYPLVLKLAFGIGSDNVRLIHSFEEGQYWTSKLFGEGLISLKIKEPRPLLREIAARGRDAAKTLLGIAPTEYSLEPDIQRGCVLFQEFLPDNQGDLRILVIGNRAFGFQRKNRPGDFRASGSGLINWNPQEISETSVRLALNTAKKLGQQVITFDILHRNDEPHIVEMSYYFEAPTYYQCPGHWVLEENISDQQLQWIEGQMRAEDAIFHDFMNEIQKKISVHSKVEF